MEKIAADVGVLSHGSKSYQGPIIRDSMLCNKHATTAPSAVGSVRQWTIHTTWACIHPTFRASERVPRLAVTAVLFLSLFLSPYALYIPHRDQRKGQQRPEAKQRAPTWLDFRQVQKRQHRSIPGRLPVRYFLLFVCHLVHSRPCFAVTPGVPLDLPCNNIIPALDHILLVQLVIQRGVMENSLR